MNIIIPRVAKAQDCLLLWNKICDDINDSCTKHTCSLYAVSYYRVYYFRMEENVKAEEGMEVDVPAEEINKNKRFFGVNNKNGCQMSGLRPKKVKDTSEHKKRLKKPKRSQHSNDDILMKNEKNKRTSEQLQDDDDDDCKLSVPRKFLKPSWWIILVIINWLLM